MNAEPAKLVRFYLNEHDRCGSKPLYEAMVDRCRELGVAGVTVLRALEGFGDTAQLHHPHLLAHDQPVILLIVERPERALQVLPVLEGMMGSGMVAIDEVELIAISKSARV